MDRANTVGTIFRYLRSPLDFFDETLGAHVIKVAKKYSEVKLPVRGSTSGFYIKGVFLILTGYVGLIITLNISKNIFSVKSITSGLEFYFRFFKNTV